MGNFSTLPQWIFESLNQPLPEFQQNAGGIRTPRNWPWGIS